MHGGALAQKASKQKELSDHKLVKASNKRHGGGYSACALDNIIYIYIYMATCETYFHQNFDFQIPF